MSFLRNMETPHGAWSQLAVIVTGSRTGEAGTPRNKVRGNKEV